MRGKALTLALLLFASALAGCIREDTEEPIDRTGDDLDLDDVADIFDDLESCEDAGGTWIEVQNRPIDGFCDMSEDEDDRDDEQEISQEDCERRNGTWIETPERPIDGYCDFGEDDDRGDEQEITQEGCEERGFNWTEAPDREGVFYCDFGEQDREDREITQEDCERRNGTWTEAPDREGEFYCDFDGNGGNSTSNSNPVITILGEQELELLSTETENYVDSGATCHDEEEGDVSHLVEVSGDVVNMGHAGTYVIFYNCEDSDGNRAVEEQRNVTIIDGDCLTNEDCTAGFYCNEDNECVVDTDGDGVADDDDAFPNDANETTDSDGDGVGDNADAFPNDANETMDSDGDGVGDNADQCDDTESGATVGDDGCVDVHEHFIDISGMAFSESTITISIGDIITWTNQDGAPHSATGDNGEFDSGALNNGESFTFIFNTAGTYTYHCSIHNGMTATIIVE